MTEILDNAIDEVQAGHAENVQVTPLPLFSIALQMRVTARWLLLQSKHSCWRLLLHQATTAVLLLPELLAGYQ